MILAHGQHKTAAVLYGKRAGAGIVKVLPEHHGLVHLPLVAAYKHLGVQQQPAGGMTGELRYRVGQARSAFQEARRKIFRSRGISLSRKAFPFRHLFSPASPKGPDLGLS